jgi:methylthioribose-1-phosphate isomerase
VLPTIAWQEGTVRLLDQRLLPHQEVYLTLESVAGMAEAIRSMAIRGAPAIGVAAAYGMALAAQSLKQKDRAAFSSGMEDAQRELESTRPTAVNLFWALQRIRRTLAALDGQAPARIAEAILAEALEMDREDVETNRAIGRYGAEVVPQQATILTHCNAGALATAGYGTALGVVRAAVEAGKRVLVYADETRPFLQGARLTAWELVRDSIPVIVIADNMAGQFLRRGEIDVVIVGADRIARNGDFANKIGTYSLAVLAQENRVPFYTAAPLSTVDFECPSGDQIPIEERDPSEVTHLFGIPVAAPGAGARNPAFDVTPARYLAGIITECGIARPPLLESLARLSRSKQQRHS